jgi:hypothetical protein
MTHISEDRLEHYSMGKLSENELPPIEEHLLLCELCQALLTEVDGIICKIVIGARQIAEEKQSPSNLRVFKAASGS